MITSQTIRNNISVQVWVGVFGLIAAVASFRSGWKATALPSPSSHKTEKSDPADSEVVEDVVGYDIS